jgi:hypothetical protein
LTCPFKFFYIPIRTHSKDIYNQLFANYIHLVLMPKVYICTFDKKMCLEISTLHWTLVRAMCISTQPCMVVSIFKNWIKDIGVW